MVGLQIYMTIYSLWDPGIEPRAPRLLSKFSMNWTSPAWALKSWNHILMLYWQQIGGRKDFLLHRHSGPGNPIFTLWALLCHPAECFCRLPTVTVWPQTSPIFSWACLNSSGIWNLSKLSLLVGYETEQKMPVFLLSHSTVRGHNRPRIYTARV